MIFIMFETYLYIFLNLILIFRAMAQRPPSSRIAARNETTDLMGVLCGIMESLQEQIILLRDGLLAA